MALHDKSNGKNWDKVNFKPIGYWGSMENGVGGCVREEADNTLSGVLFRQSHSPWKKGSGSNMGVAAFNASRVIERK